MNYYLFHKIEFLNVSSKIVINTLFYDLLYLNNHETCKIIYQWKIWLDYLILGLEIIVMLCAYKSPIISKRFTVSQWNLSTIFNYKRYSFSHVLFISFQMTDINSAYRSAGSYNSYFPSNHINRSLNNLYPNLELNINNLSKNGSSFYRYPTEMFCSYVFPGTSICSSSNKYYANDSGYDYRLNNFMAEQLIGSYNSPCNSEKPKRRRTTTVEQRHAANVR